MRYYYTTIFNNLHSLQVNVLIGLNQCIVRIFAFDKVTIFSKNFVRNRYFVESD